MRLLGVTAEQKDTGRDKRRRRRRNRDERTKAELQLTKDSRQSEVLHTNHWAIVCSPPPIQTLTRGAGTPSGGPSFVRTCCHGLLVCPSELYAVTMY